MYHFLAVHVYQPPSDTFELSGGLSAVMTVNGGDETLQARTDSHPCAP